MCGRFVQACSSADLLALCEALDLDLSVLEPDYNVSPGRDILGLVEDEGSICGKQMRWGIPRGEKKGICINARCESVEYNPFFAEPLRTGRCAIPASGFYEWDKKRHPKQPWYFKMKECPVLCFAGLMIQEDNRTYCTILTTRANEKVSVIHERMPVIMSCDDYMHWLHEKGTGQSYECLFNPYPSEKMEAYSVSARVNRPAENDPDCVRRIDLSSEPEQMEFF